MSSLTETDRELVEWWVHAFTGRPMELELCQHWFGGRPGEIPLELDGYSYDAVGDVLVFTFSDAYPDQISQPSSTNRYRVEISQPSSVIFRKYKFDKPIVTTQHEPAPDDEDLIVKQAKKVRCTWYWGGKVNEDTYELIPGSGEIRVSHDWSFTNSPLDRTRGPVDEMVSLVPDPLWRVKRARWHAKKQQQSKKQTPTG